MLGQPYRCSQAPCQAKSVTFVNHDDFKTHIRERHNQPRKFQCSGCSSEFARSRDLQRHLRGKRGALCIKDSRVANLNEPNNVTKRPDRTLVVSGQDNLSSRDAQLNEEATTDMRNLKSALTDLALLERSRIMMIGESGNPRWSCLSRNIRASRLVSNDPLAVRLLDQQSMYNIPRVTFLATFGAVHTLCLAILQLDGRITGQLVGFMYGRMLILLRRLVSNQDKFAACLVGTACLALSVLLGDQAYDVFHSLLTSLAADLVADMRQLCGGEIISTEDLGYNDFSAMLTGFEDMIDFVQVVSSRLLSSENSHSRFAHRAGQTIISSIGCLTSSAPVWERSGSERLAGWLPDDEIIKLRNRYDASVSRLDSLLLETHGRLRLLGCTGCTDLETEAMDLKND